MPGGKEVQVYNSNEVSRIQHLSRSCNLRVERPPRTVEGINRWWRRYILEQWRTVKGHSQCIWPTFDKTNHQIPPSKHWFPNNENMTKGNKERKLYWQAYGNCRTCEQVFPPEQRNYKGAHESPTTRWQVKQAKESIPWITRSRCFLGKKEEIKTWVCQDSRPMGYERNHIHWPNRVVPNQSKTWYKIHHDYGRNWQQHCNINHS